MELTRLQLEVGEWSKRNFPNNKPYVSLLGAVEELGELAHAHIKNEQGIRGTPEEHMMAKMDAVGDVLIYLADYCERSGIVMDICVEKAWAEVKHRDWQKYPKNGKSE